MERVTISIDGDLLAALDDLIARRGYANRSEAVRDILRQVIAPEDLGNPGQRDDQPCLGTLSYVYDHGRRDLGRRLIETQHHRHDLTVATLHVHLDHNACLEVAILRGPADDLRAMADSVTTERGVRYGTLHLIPTALPAPGDSGDPLGGAPHGHHGQGHNHDHGPHPVHDPDHRHDHDP